MNTLLSLYKKNIIVYPRTESDYIVEQKLLSYVAHPPLNHTGDYFSPLREKEYEYNEKSLLLELHNRRILTPANLQSVTKRIQKAKGGRSEKKSAAVNKTLEEYDLFLKSINQEEKDYFIKNEILHYRTNSANSKILRFDNNIKNVSDVFELQNKMPQTQQLNIGGQL